MDVLREVLDHEVYPAIGCTEPISCAYAAAVAAARLGEPVERLVVRVDPATYKNGSAVTVPNSGGAKGNLIAAALGAVLARPQARMEILAEVPDGALRRAQAMIREGRCALEGLDGQVGFRVEALAESAAHTARCVLAMGHTSIVLLEVDGRPVPDLAPPPAVPEEPAYKQALRRMSLSEMMELPEHLTAGDRDNLRRGIEMNLALADRGIAVRRAAYQLHLMREEGFAGDDLFFRTKLKVASAVDARMAGVPLAAMTSGGSGNQGILVTLIVHDVGTALGVPTERILKSLALAHLINSCVKCFVGELAALCGCALAAGIAASIALVYQQAGADAAKMAMAVNNVVADLGGMICDGAKPGCSMKAITSVDSAIRSSLMALKGYGVSAGDGIVGRSAEQTIRNLGRIVLEGMPLVDATVLGILRDGHAADAGKAPGAARG